MEVQGHYMFRVVKKLKDLIKPMRKLLLKQGNLHNNVDRLRKERDEIQKSIDNNLLDLNLRQIEATCLKNFKEAQLDKERFLKQKSKVEWLDVGDANSAFFHKSLKCKNHRSRIEVIKDPIGKVHEGGDAQIAFVNHYTNFLGANDEIKLAMFSIGENKVPSPDGYTSAFFKSTWDVVGHECISKINTNRIKEGLHELVSMNQSAFVPGRRISDNILLTQELMHNYHRSSGPPRYAFTIDIQKAYDRVDCGKFDKEYAFFCNVPDHVKYAILAIMPFEEGSLPVRYLGVPLISTHLLYKDCKILVEKLEKRITDWQNKSLSFAGRLQLIRSVLSSLHVYWASVLILPTRIIKELESKMRGFLWNQGDYVKGKSKVSWKVVCLPKSEGALGIRRIVECSDLCPIHSYISPREASRAGFNLGESVADLIDEGIWKCPVAWLDLFLILIDLPNIHLSPNTRDSLLWKSSDGKEHNFSSLAVWDTIRSKQEEVVWHKVVWFSQMIPRHAFLMWLLVRRKLKTQDIIMQWKGGGNMNFNLVCCPLRQQGRDSHNHLFFECLFSSQVWLRVRHLAQMHQVNSRWDDIYDWLIQRAKSNSARSVIGKLLVAVSAYFIWQERNQRLFSNISQNPDQIQDLIASTVRLKLVTLRFKNTAQVDRFVQAWNLPHQMVVFDQVRC
uniref:uncharacterized protein LOC122591585 n=1 Tax=Erigeron canadensis TaxID=72917 RepID=UPI001CB99F68|nr:uncharacterized protein LOC122591585 [Erigeron canadensis]